MRVLVTFTFDVQIFNKKQAAERKEGWVMGNNLFFRMHRISDIYFVGGFGTVQWVDVAEYAATTPDSIVLDNPHRTLQVRSYRFLMILVMPTLSARQNGVGRAATIHDIAAFG